MGARRSPQSRPEVTATSPQAGSEPCPTPVRCSGMVAAAEVAGVQIPDQPSGWPNLATAPLTLAITPAGAAGSVDLTLGCQASGYGSKPALAKDDVASESAASRWRSPRPHGFMLLDQSHRLTQATATTNPAADWPAVGGCRDVRARSTGGRCRPAQQCVRAASPQYARPCSAPPANRGR